MEVLIAAKKRWTIACVAAGLLVVGMCYGQVGTASLQGTVTDQSGAVIAGATATVQNVQTGVARILATDAEGRYSAPELQVGQYQVQAQMTGFETTVRSGIVLAVGDERVLDLQLP
jgi:uncharacterized surface anchored protein